MRVHCSRNLIYYLFIIILFLLPSRFAYLFPLGNIETTLLIFGVVLMLFIFIIFCLANRGKVIFKRIYLFWYIFILYNFIISGVYTVTSKGFFNIVPFIILLFPMLISFALFQLDNIDILKILKFFTIITFILSIQVIAISLSGIYLLALLNISRVSIVGKSVSYIFRAFSTFGPSGPTSVAIANGLVLNIYFYILSEDIKNKILFLIGIIFNMLAIYLCFTRSIVIAIILAFIMSTILNYKKLLRYNIRIFIFLMAISFFSISLFILYKIPLYRFFTVEIREEGSSDWIRWMAVNLTLKMFTETPLIGAGMGFFYPRDLSVEYISFEGYLIPRDPHNLYVLLLYEGGILGFALFIISIIVLLIDIINEIKLSKIEEEQLLKNALLINILVILMYNFFSSYLAVGFRMSLLFWFLISLSLRRNYGKKKCNFY